MAHAGTVQMRSGDPMAANSDHAAHSLRSWPWGHSGRSRRFQEQASRPLANVGSPRDVMRHPTFCLPFAEDPGSGTLS
jgi:hypothetical protein